MLHTDISSHKWDVRCSYSGNTSACNPCSRASRTQHIQKRIDTRRTNRHTIIWLMFATHKHLHRPDTYFISYYDTVIVVRYGLGYILGRNWTTDCSSNMSVCWWGIIIIRHHRIIVSCPLLFLLINISHYVLLNLDWKSASENLPHPSQAIKQEYSHGKYRKSTRNNPICWIIISIVRVFFD